MTAASDPGTRGAVEPLFAGLRVIEVASMVMVPCAGMMLAEYGADVIKVEPPEGDLNRRGHLLATMPDSDLEYCFLQDNRNKRGIVLDLKSKEGHGILLDLVREADVFLTNYRPKALARLGLSYDDLEAINPRLVYAQGTGFGDHGPEADKPGFDSVSYWSRSALEFSFFPLEGWLRFPTYGSGDHPSGMALFASIVMALYGRERSGKGCRVTTSLLANGAWSNSTTIQARLVDAKFHPKVPRDEARSYSGVYYRCKSGEILKLIIVNIEQGWPRVCRALGRPDLIDHPDYRNEEARRGEGRTRTLIHLFDDIFMSEDIEHWQAVLEEHDVPHSVIADYDHVADDEQMAANGIFVDIEEGPKGNLRSVANPLRLSDRSPVPPRLAPALGEHTREILREMGHDDEQIGAWLEQGVVAGP